MNIGALLAAAKALARGEEFGRADRLLQPRIAFHRLRPIANLGLLERVATLIVRERFAVLTQILERLGEREAEVVPIGQLSCRRGLLGAHAGELLVREPVGLEVREAPVGVAEARPQRRGGAVGVLGLLASAERLEDMPDRQLHVGRLRRLHEERAIHLQRPLVLTEPDAGGRVGRPVAAVVRIGLQERLELLKGAHVLVALQERPDEVEARRVVLRRELEHGVEQELGVVEHLELDADAGEQPHRLDVVAVLEEIGRARSRSAGTSSPSENMPVAVTISGGQLLELRDVARGGRARPRALAGHARTASPASPSSPAAPD